jgi:phosphoglycolate phosphatase-like HAD superfamily hydrolase
MFLFFFTAHNSISDRGLCEIIAKLLLPSAEGVPPVLETLYLQANACVLTMHFFFNPLMPFLSRIQLSEGPTPSLLSAALSHPSCSLIFLSLTENQRISRHPRGLAKFFSSDLSLTSLRHLCLNVCRLDYRSAVRIARFLEDPRRSGKLLVLELNGNVMGKRGVARLVKAVTSGRNTSLCELQVAANEEDEGAVQEVAQLLANESTDEDQEEEEEEDVEPDKSGSEYTAELVAALERNQRLRLAVRKAALSLLPVARVLVNARPAPEPEQSLPLPPAAASSTSTMTMDDVFEQVDGRPPWDAAKAKTQAQTQSQAPKPFPYNRLPPELKIHVLRAVGMLNPVPLPPTPPPRQPRSHPHHPHDRSQHPHDHHQQLASPLTETQFLRILKHAADRSTLGHYFRNDTERQAWLRAAAATGVWTRDVEAVEDAIDRFLQRVNCDTWERVVS